ncbi:MAG: hypothetical protein M3540_09875 [Actinomycetota bacterium]|nr:hypothetical protein [Actinomycetota bacterium]
MKRRLAFVMVALAAGCGGDAAAPPADPPSNRLASTVVTGHPATGVAVERYRKRVELVGLDGDVHARLRDVQLGYVREPGRVILRTGSEQWLFQPGRGTFVRYSFRPKRPRVGCAVASKRGGTTLLLCSPKPEYEGQFPLPKTIEIESAGRARRVLAIPPFPSTAPGVGSVGHWESAELSPDGRTVLAQWSAECEIPIAFLIPVAGGKPQPIAGSLREHPESIGLGWSPDGLAVVSLPALACGRGYDGPGIYLVSTDGKPVRAITRGADIRGAMLWTG